MLQLNESLLIAQGAQRKCYRHPSDPDKCIKISKPTSKRSQHLEHKYYSVLERRNISWDCLSRHYGTVETNQGTGYVFDLIRDFDGTISHTVADYLNSNISNDVRKEDILASLTLLKVYLYREKIILRNIRPYNFVYKRLDPRNGRIVIIDNIGHHNNFPHLSSYFPSLATIDIAKKWNTFEDRYIKAIST